MVLQSYRKEVVSIPKPGRKKLNHNTSIFVGGAIDGELRDVPPDQNDYRAPWIIPMRAFDNLAELPDSTELEYDEYVRERFRAGNSVFSVFRLKDEPIEKTFERIIIRYSECAKLVNKWVI